MTTPPDVRAPAARLRLAVGGEAGRDVLDALARAGFDVEAVPADDPRARSASLADAAAYAAARAEAQRAIAFLATCRELAQAGGWSFDPESGAFASSPEAESLLGRAGSPIADRAAWLAAAHDEERERLGAWLDDVVAGRAARPIEHGLPCGRRVRQHARRLVQAGRTEIAGFVCALAPGDCGPLARDGFVARAAEALLETRPCDQLAVMLVRAVGRASGHPVDVSQRVRDAIRDRDGVGRLGPALRDATLGRYDPGRLALLFPSLGRAHDAYRIARRLQEALAADDADASFGIALFPGDGGTAEALLDAASGAERRAREPGHAGIHFHTAATNAAAFERLTLETSLRLALERGELEVHYQPKVEVATGRIVAFEALVRWNHPELGTIPPNRFVPIAEETGLIVPIGEHVLEQACRQSRAWLEQGLPPVVVAVNLSSVQFADPELASHVRRVLARTGLEASRLELELTESILLQRADATIATLNELKRMGVHLSIDDFGTGYSSLSYLKRFPIDSLKIDQSFVRDVTTNAEDAAITTSIILMGKSLNLKVVAEGVETQSQLEFLRVLECDEAQGFLFSRPVSGEKAAQLLATAVANYT